MDTLNTPATSSDWLQTSNKAIFWLHKTMVWGLTAQALWAIYTSVKLILLDLPNAPQLDINFLMNDLIVVLFTALTSGGVALTFGRSHNQQSELWQALVGLTLGFFNFWLIGYLGSSNPGSVLLPWVETVFAPK